MSYLRAVALHVPFAPAVSREVQWRTKYDVEAWTRDRFARPLTAYAFPTEQTLHAVTTPETRALIETKVATFGEHPSGLGKFTRTMFSRDFRRTLVRPGEMTGSDQAA